jgi:hypothetical protein
MSFLGTYDEVRTYAGRWPAYVLSSHAVTVSSHSHPLDAFSAPMRMRTARRGCACTRAASGC